MEHKLCDARLIQDYVKGGRAIFTLVSPTTGRRYTYKMLRSKSSPSQYEIRLLQGDDNTQDYHFIGRYYLRKFAAVWLKDDGWYNRDTLYPLESIQQRSLRAVAMLLLDTRGYLDAGLMFWTSGRCAKCGRLLTDPASIACGFGPHCGGKR